MELLCIRLSQASAKRRKMSTISSCPLLLHLSLEAWIDPLYCTATLLFYPVDKRQGSNPQAPALQSVILPWAKKTYPRGQTPSQRPEFNQRSYILPWKSLGCWRKAFLVWKEKKSNINIDSSNTYEKIHNTYLDVRLRGRICWPAEARGEDWTEVTLGYIENSRPAWSSWDSNRVGMGREFLGQRENFRQSVLTRDLFAALHISKALPPQGIKAH